MLRRRCAATLLVLLPLASAWAQTPPAKPVSVDTARIFLADANQRLLALSNALNRAQWVAANFITEDTEKISADANQQMIAATMELAAEATRFDGLELPDDLARQMLLLKLASIPLPAPRDLKAQTELTEIAAGLEGAYGRGKYCPPGKPCLALGDLEKIMAESRDYDRLLEAWSGWHQVAVPLRPRYQRFVELGNQGARELGFHDLGALWRSNYDMPPDAFAADLDRLWGQVRPLYEALHAYVRASLRKQYGDKVPVDGPIPAHLLGNMWAQDWGNVYPLLPPPPGAGADYDLATLLRAKQADARAMVRYGEGFFTSLGFAPLPKTFWERSLFVKPADRDVVCHASAWDVDNDQDLRIKMCIDVNAEDFVTVHHELGHNFYQRAYRTLPYLYRNSANDGFHEAIGDAVALSVTPGYLNQVGLLARPPAAGTDLPYLMKMALDKVAFLPFGLVVDQWRFKVFSGEVGPGDYNKAWWELRQKYQGVKAPVARSESDFDAGAKYHVASNTPYTRYFLAAILQFQFHRAMCREAGFQGPLYQCSVYGDQKVGKKLEQMLTLGLSRPWPDALFALTGERQVDATAILDYFAPLKQWLDEQNKANQVGWPQP